MDNSSAWSQLVLLLRTREKWPEPIVSVLLLQHYKKHTYLYHLENQVAQTGNMSVTGYTLYFLDLTLFLLFASILKIKA